MIFIFCSAINDNLNYIDYLYTRYGKKLDNINNNKKLIKINKNIKEVLKDLFK
ncbi:hypothetical protein SDC9_106679 [bioreactor metagenome]|jgi:hypothetical protein|uniref:Uncharacterized protein n=1 Tax=bioreactor metagenome TaxID=1076179 RepID=A0A645B9M0_9ZZZZ